MSRLLIFNTNFCGISSRVTKVSRPKYRTNESAGIGKFSMWTLPFFFFHPRKDVPSVVQSLSGVVGKMESSDINTMLDRSSTRRRKEKSIDIKRNEEARKRPVEREDRYVPLHEITLEKLVAQRARRVYPEQMPMILLSYPASAIFDRRLFSRGTRHAVSPRF